MSHKWVEPEIVPVDIDGSIALYLTLECADVGCYAVRTIGAANAPDGGPNDVGPMITSTDDHQRATTPKERAQALAACWVWYSTNC